MKQIYYLITISIFLLSGNRISSQTIWIGATETFTKSSGADSSLEANQDRLTNNVWLTRANSGGLFNAVIDTNGNGAASPTNVKPSDTEWAVGTTTNYNTLTYSTLSALFGGNFTNIVNGQDLVLHLITDDIYIDIKFTGWQTQGGGGGFSYERSSDSQILSIGEIELEKSIKLFPNPSNDYIQVSGLTGNEKYILYNILGTEIRKGVMSNNEQISIRSFTSGLYFLKFENGNTIKFLKE